MTTESDSARAASRGYLRILLVEQRADPPEARATLDQLGCPLHHHAPQARPGIRIAVNGHRDARILHEVLHLAAVVSGGEIDPAAMEHVTDWHQVRHAAPAHRSHAADALPLNKLGHGFLELHGGSPSHQSA